MSARPLPMIGTAGRLQADTGTLRWNATALADHLGLETSRAVRRWLNGSEQVPDPIARWIATLAEFVRANPPPARPDSSAADIAAMEPSPVPDGLDGTLP